MVILWGRMGRNGLIHTVRFFFFFFASCSWFQLFLQSFSFSCFIYFFVTVQQSNFVLCDTVVIEIFSGFSGAAGPRLFTIHQIDASTNNLPKAHTW